MEDGSIVYNEEFSLSNSHETSGIDIKGLLSLHLVDHSNQGSPNSSTNSSAHHSVDPNEWSTDWFSFIPAHNQQQQQQQQQQHNQLSYSTPPPPLLSSPTTNTTTTLQRHQSSLSLSTTNSTTCRNQTVNSMDEIALIEQLHNAFHSEEGLMISTRTSSGSEGIVSI